MLIFGADKKMRGCYREVSQNIASGKGAYLTIAGLPTLGGGSGGEIESCFVSGIAITQKERYFVLPCFKDKNFLYTFGHDPNSSTLEVTFTTFLVNPDGADTGDSMRNVLQWYEKSRVSVNPKKAVLTIGSAASSGYVIGMTYSTADAHFNLQTFTLSMLVTSSQGGAG